MSKKKNFFRSSVAYEAEYLAVLTYADANAITTPSQGQNIINNNIIKDLKDAGAWQFDLFYYFKQTCDEDFAKINWANPSSNYLSAGGTTGSDIVFTSGDGYSCTGTSNKYLDTGFIPSTHAVEGSYGDRSVIFQIYGTSETGRVTPYGGRTTTANQTYLRIDSTSLMYCRLNGNDSNLTSGFTYNGHWHILDNGTNRVVYQDGSLVNSSTKVSGSLSAASMYIFNIHNALENHDTFGIRYLADGAAMESLQDEIEIILNV